MHDSIALREDTRGPCSWASGRSVMDADQIHWSAVSALLLILAAAPGVGAQARPIGSTSVRSEIVRLPVVDRQDIRFGRLSVAGAPESRILTIASSLTEGGIAHVAIALGSIDPLRDGAVPPPVVTGPVDVTAVRTILERLHVALGDYELSAATQALADLASLDTRASAAPDLAQLRSRVDKFEYEDAQVITGRLLDQLDEATPS